MKKIAIALATAFLLLGCSSEKTEEKVSTPKRKNCSSITRIKTKNS